MLDHHQRSEVFLKMRRLCPPELRWHSRIREAFQVPEGNVAVCHRSSRLPRSPARMLVSKVLPEVSGPGKHLGRSLVSASLLEQATADIEAFLGFFPLHKFCFQSGCLLCLTSFAEMKSLYPCPKEIGGRMVES